MSAAASEAAEKVALRKRILDLEKENHELREQAYKKPRNVGRPRKDKSKNVELPRGMTESLKLYVKMKLFPKVKYTSNEFFDNKELNVLSKVCEHLGFASEQDQEKYRHTIMDIIKDRIDELREQSKSAVKEIVKKGVCVYWCLVTASIPLIYSNLHLTPFFCWTHIQEQFR